MRLEDIAYDPPGSYSTSPELDEGRPLAADWRPGFTFRVRPGKTADWWPNPLGYCICSSRMLALITTRVTGPDDLQVFDAPLVDHKTSEAVGGYHLLNFVRRLPAMNVQASEVRWGNKKRRKAHSVMKWVFDASLIPSDVHAFRPEELPSTLVWSDELAQDMVGHELVGLAFKRTKST